MSVLTPPAPAPVPVPAAAPAPAPAVRPAPGAYDRARAEIGRFVGARRDDVVLVVRDTALGLDLLARAVPDGGEIVVLDVRPDGNGLPWRHRTHRRVEPAYTLAGTVARVADALAERPAALLAVTGASNVTGELLPIAQLADLAHVSGARIVVDAAELAPHRRIDLAATGVDFVAFCGHELDDPCAAAVLVGHGDWLDAVAPDLAAQKPDVAGAVALAAACRSLAALPEGALAAHEAELRDRLVTGLHALPGTRVLAAWPDATERVGVVGFTLAGHDPGRLAAVLAAEHGVGVGVVPHGAGALRVGLGLGTSSEDVDALLVALEDVVTS